MILSESKKKKIWLCQISKLVHKQFRAKEDKRIILKFMGRLISYLILMRLSKE